MLRGQVVVCHILPALRYSEGVPSLQRNFWSMNVVIIWASPY
ncbi:hypothetical protein MGWOODY_Hyp134 [hydrothermal vent metagenome]|uniref:Uncharacterized protein n=1 Tax=hydrothermal vent metagenome TaxID=652676 RepID=A0A160U017_9ZZZZ